MTGPRFPRRIRRSGDTSRNRSSSTGRTSTTPDRPPPRTHAACPSASPCRSPRSRLDTGGRQAVGDALAVTSSARSRRPARRTCRPRARRRRAPRRRRRALRARRRAPRPAREVVQRLEHEHEVEATVPPPTAAASSRTKSVALAHAALAGERAARRRSTPRRASKPTTCARGTPRPSRPWRSPGRSRRRRRDRRSRTQAVAHVGRRVAASCRAGRPGRPAG